MSANTGSLIRRILVVDGNAQVANAGISMCRIGVTRKAYHKNTDYFGCVDQDMDEMTLQHLMWSLYDYKVFCPIILVVWICIAALKASEVSLVQELPAYILAAFIFRGAPVHAIASCVISSTSIGTQCAIPVILIMLDCSGCHNYMSSNVKAGYLPAFIFFFTLSVFKMEKVKTHGHLLVFATFNTIVQSIPEMLLYFTMFTQHEALKKVIEVVTIVLGDTTARSPLLFQWLPQRICACRDL